MKKVMLNMNYNRKIEDGSCVVQCFELLFKYFGHDICSYTMLGMSECFDVRYRKLDYELKISAKVEINRSWHLERFLNKKSIFNITRSSFENVAHGLKYLIKSLNDGIPVCVGLNPYYVTYSKDYHTNYGGLFKNYHMLIINGYDLEKEEFYVIDPALDVEKGIIPFVDFKCGWNEPIGMRDNYVPYTYYKFYPKKEDKFENTKYKCMAEEALENFRTYEDNSIVEFMNEKFLQGKYAIAAMISDLKIMNFSGEDLDISVKSLQNIYDGIFNGIRWTRKSYYLFLENNVNYDNKEYIVTREQFGALFEKWSNVGMKLLFIIQAKKYENLRKIVEEITQIFELEQFLVKEIINELN